MLAEDFGTFLRQLEPDPIEGDVHALVTHDAGGHVASALSGATAVAFEDQGDQDYG